MFSSKTTGPISTKLCTKHPWVIGIKVCSNEVTHPFPRENNNEIAKIHRFDFEKSSSELQGQYNQTWHKKSLGERELSLFKEEPFKGNNGYCFSRSLSVRLFVWKLFTFTSSFPELLTQFHLMLFFPWWRRFVFVKNKAITFPLNHIGNSFKTLLYNHTSDSFVLPNALLQVWL